MYAPARHAARCRRGAALSTPLVAIAALIGASGAQARSAYPAAAQRALIRAHPAGRARAKRVRRSPARHARAGASSSRRRARRSHRRHRPKLRGNPARALAAFEAMQRYYYIPGSGLYKGEPFSYLWPFSQAFAATVSMTNVKGVRRVPGLKSSLARQLRARLIGLRSYFDGSNAGASEGVFTSTLAAFDGTVAPPTGPGGAKYYDDNDWIGIALVRVYERTHQAFALQGAESLMAFEMAGWETNPKLGCPGGIPFSNSVDNHDRNTVTNAPAAELAAQLYRLTGDGVYLQFAETAYEWVRACLLLPDDLYGDHVGRRGRIEPALWSYNQGTMIGAGTLLYQASGDGAYLYQARQTAKAALAYFTLERLNSENPFFPSIYLRNLLYLDSVTHDPPGPKLAQAYVNYAWQHLRSSANLFLHGSPPSGQLLYQAAIVQIYALLSSPASTYF
jgi:Glycosyl hydrolase family 76